MKEVKMLLAYKDCQDGTMNIAFFHTIEQCNDYLRSTEEERDEDPYEKGSVENVIIKINEDGNIEPFKLNIYL